MHTEPTILITGGARRIGRHCAQRLIEAGYRVMVTARHERPATELPPGVELLRADFASTAGIEALIDTLNRRRIQLRAIIHNASEWHTDEAGAEGFEAMFQVHMLAPYLINSACERWFASQPVADIIHITDYVAQRGSAKHTAYAATKAALENLTLSFASRLAPRIKVNSIAPSLILFNEGDSDSYRRKALAKSALGIEPGPEVVYQAVRYLLDNPYVTGSCLALDGGRHLKPAR